MITNRKEAGFPLTKAHKVKEEVQADKSIMENLEETDQQLAESFKKDRKWWKVARLIGKDEEDYNDIVMLISTHYKLLKDIFIYTAAGVDWPCINQVQMQLFCDSLNLIDGKLVSMNDI